MRATITAGLPLLNCNGSVYYLLQGQTRFRYSRQQLERGPSSSTRTRPYSYTALGVRVSVGLVDFLGPEQTGAFWLTRHFHRFQLRRQLFHLNLGLCNCSQSLAASHSLILPPAFLSSVRSHERQVEADGNNSSRAGKTMTGQARSILTAGAIWRWWTGHVTLFALTGPDECKLCASVHVQEALYSDVRDPWLTSHAPQTASDIQAWTTGNAGDSKDASGVCK